MSLILEWIPIGEEHIAAQYENYTCSVQNGKKGSWHYSVIFDEVVIEDNRLTCPDETCAKEHAIKAIIRHKQKQQVAINEAKVLNLVNDDELDLDKAQFQLLPSRLLLHVQAAMFYLAHPDTRRIIVECLDEVQTTTSLEQKLPMSKNMLYKYTTKLVVCGVIKEVNQDETRKIGFSKNYIANKRAIALAMKFAEKYIDEVALEDMLAIQTARLAYRRAGNLS